MEFRTNGANPERQWDLLPTYLFCCQPLRSGIGLVCVRSYENRFGPRSWARSEEPLALRVE